jgi:hypothetical protein
MLYGLDAMAHGAILALLGVPLATWLLWRLASGLAASRWQRVLLTGLASFGAVALAGLGYSLGFERSGFEDEAIFGVLLGALAFQLLACPILFLISPGA